MKFLMANFSQLHRYLSLLFVKMWTWLLVTNVIMNIMISVWEKQECLTVIVSVLNNL